MKRIVSLMGVLTWVLLAPISAWTAVSITLDLDRYEATPSDAVRLTVGVSGTRSCDAPPHIKGLETFSVSQGGTSSRVEIVNGQYTAQLDYVYFIQPSKTGTFNIGPAHVKVEGKGYNSNTATLHVVKASAAPKGPEADIFLTASLSAETAYVEEEVLYVLKLYLKKRVSDISLSLPETNDLGFKQLEKPKEYRATAHGHSYGVVELRYSLIPDKPGAYTIEPAEIHLTVYDASKKGRRGLFDDPFFDDPFFRRGRPLRVLSEPLHLTVRELPAAGRPQDFSGLVGTLKMRSSLEPTRLRVGESATLTVRLKGEGNVNRMPDLTLPEIDGVKVYADEPAITITPGPKGLSGLKVMKWALVPEAAGKYRIPPTAVSFFDKGKNRYETLQTPPRTLEVLAKKGKKPGGHEVIGSGKGEEGVSPRDHEGPHKKQEVKTIGEDILPIHTAVSDQGQAAPFKRQMGPMLWVILLAPFAAYVAAYIGVGVRRKSVRSLPAIRARRAAGNFVKAFKAAQSDPRTQMAALRGYINDRFGCSLAAITPDEAARILKENGVTPETSDKLRRMFQQIEADIYQGEPNKDFQGYEGMRALVKQIEKELS